MVAKPEVSVTAEEPKGDALGQFWSPAKVTLTWPAVGQIAGPSVQISLVAPINGQMTVDELRRAHMRSAHDVLTAALLSLEEVPQAAPVKRQKVPR